MATVHLPRSLVTLFNEPPPRHIQIEAATLRDVVDGLERSWPGMRDRLCEPGPRISEHINVFVDGERQRDLALGLRSETVIHIIPAVAGGTLALTRRHPFPSVDAQIEVAW